VRVPLRVRYKFSLHGLHLLVCLVLVAPGCENRITELDGGIDADDGLADDGDNQAADFDGGADLYDGGPDRPWADWDSDPRCSSLIGLEGEQLRNALVELVDNHTALSYEGARDEIFTDIDNIDGQVQCVYTGVWITTDIVPSNDIMNVEHTWCQSWGADTLPAKSDLNHLFPAITGVNSTRSNYPFGEVIEVSWSSGGSKRGLDGWGTVVFEPRDEHKGDCARALFYFSVRYNMEIEDRMEQVIRGWNWADLPDAKEETRCDRIEQLQDTRNPFVDCPELVDRISNY